jgi:hypothetical protein
MPATGVRAPARMLVAVRAMAPVAGRPPNSADAVLATPCATSSALERWRPPVMPSATTADSSDSTPAEEGDGQRRRQQLGGALERNVGKSNCGSAAGMLAEGRADGRHRQSDRQRASEPATTAIRKPGHCGRQRRSRRSAPCEPAPVRAAG